MVRLTYIRDECYSIGMDITRLIDSLQPRLNLRGYTRLWTTHLAQMLQEKRDAIYVLLDGIETGPFISLTREIGQTEEDIQVLENRMKHMIEEAQMGADKVGKPFKNPELWKNYCEVGAQIRRARAYLKDKRTELELLEAPHSLLYAFETFVSGGTQKQVEDILYKEEDITDRNPAKQIHIPNESMEESIDKIIEKLAKCSLDTREEHSTESSVPALQEQPEKTSPTSQESHTEPASNDATSGETLPDAAQEAGQEQDGTLQPSNSPNGDAFAGL